jgi:hypothetical protein
MGGKKMPAKLAETGKGCSPRRWQGSGDQEILL